MRIREKIRKKFIFKVVVIVLTVSLFTARWYGVEEVEAATENIYASSHITGSFTNPNNALGAYDSAWAGQLNTSTSETSRWAMQNPSGSLTGTQQIAILAKKGSNSGSPTVTVNLYENGSLVQEVIAASTVTSTTGQSFSGTFDGSVITNEADVEIEIVASAVGGSPSTRNSAQIDGIVWQVSYTPPAPTYTQNDFEWFVTANSVTLTDVWPSGSRDLAENAVIDIPAPNILVDQGDQVRLQMNFTVGSTALSASAQRFQLQYGAIFVPSGSDCTTVLTWTAVGAKAATTAAWRLFDEASIGDSTAQVNDISTSTSGAEGYYSEINASGTGLNPNGVSVGQSSEWDWPIENYSAVPATTYCFRMVKHDGSSTATAFDTYNSDGYPMITTAPGTDNLMRHGKFHKLLEKGFFWAD